MEASSLLSPPPVHVDSATPESLLHSHLLKELPQGHSCQPQKNGLEQRSVQDLEVDIWAWIFSVPGVGVGIGNSTRKQGTDSRWALPSTPWTWHLWGGAWSQDSQSRCPIKKCFPHLNVYTHYLELVKMRFLGLLRDVDILVRYAIITSTQEMGCHRYACL